MVHYVPLPKLPSAVMLYHVFRLYSFRRNFVSDQGPQFVIQFLQAFCSLLASISLSSGHHPQINSQTEQLKNQELETSLRCLASQSPNTWSKQLSSVEYAHNSLPCSSSGLFPFLRAYGYQPSLYPTLEKEVSMPSVLALFRHSRRTWAF